MAPRPWRLVAALWLFVTTQAFILLMDGSVVAVPPSWPAVFRPWDLLGPVDLGPRALAILLIVGPPYVLLRLGEARSRRRGPA